MGNTGAPPRADLPARAWTLAWVSIVGPRHRQMSYSHQAEQVGSEAIATNRRHGIHASVRPLPPRQSPRPINGDYVIVKGLGGASADNLDARGPVLPHSAAGLSAREVPGPHHRQRAGAGLQRPSRTEVRKAPGAAVTATVPPLVQSIAREAAARGGRAVIVGGWVRDRLLERDSKDVDLEVLVPPDRCARAARSVGECVRRELHVKRSPASTCRCRAGTRRPATDIAASPWKATPR